MTLKPAANNIRTELQKYPHIPDERTTHDDRYNPRKYISVQTKVNNDADFEKAYISKIVSDGWVALKNTQDILIYPKGKSFKYRLNGNTLSGAPEGTFRSGGWLLGKNDNDTENNDKYILYKGYNGAIFSLQIKDLLEVYIKSPKRDIPVFKKPSERTNFPVYLTNPDTGIDEVVFYAKDNYYKTRFMNTRKYKRAVSLGIWSWSVVFNDNF